jgi:hypothetical protein
VVLCFPVEILLRRLVVRRTIILGNGNDAGLAISASAG